MRFELKKINTHTHTHTQRGGYLNSQPPPCTFIQPSFLCPCSTFCWMALINWHRFYPAPNQNRCLSVSTALPLQCPYSSTAQREGKVRKSRIFFRYNLHLKSEILVQVKGNKSDAYSNRNDHITRVCQRDTVQNSCTPHKLTTLCLWGISQADVSEAFCSRSQYASFLFGLWGAENFPKHIPLRDRHKE